jgi:hypothetical protein
MGPGEGKAFNGMSAIVPPSHRYELNETADLGRPVTSCRPSIQPKSRIPSRNASMNSAYAVPPDNHPI